MLDSLINDSNKTYVGTFIKTPHPHIIEVASLSNLSFIVLDAEHAPFDRTSLDLCILAARVNDMPCIVRVQNSESSNILNALDCGAMGIQIPHVCTAEQAKNIVRMCHYGANGRGYAGSTRAANYGTKSMRDHISESKTKTKIIAQIEDIEGVENIESITAVEGLDAIFIGIVDLTVSYGAQDPTDDRVVQSVNRIVESAKKHKKPVGIFIGSSKQAPEYLDKGVQFFCVGSEHKMIIDGFNAQCAELIQE